MTVTPHTAPLAYLATPFSKWAAGPKDAFIKASKLAARLLVDRVNVYSPICHTFPMAEYGDLDAMDHSIWLPFDEAMMSAASVLIVAHMDGWQESKGVAHEIAFFERAGKPIFDLDDPNNPNLPMKRRVEATPIIRTLQASLAEIDKMFEEATGWGSWMSEASAHRRHIVRQLAKAGIIVEDKWVLRTLDGRVSD